MFVSRVLGKENTLGSGAPSLQTLLPSLSLSLLHLEWGHDSPLSPGAVDWLNETVPLEGVSYPWAHRKQSLLLFIKTGDTFPRMGRGLLSLVPGNWAALSQSSEPYYRSTRSRVRLLCAWHRGHRSTKTHPSLSLQRVG